MLGVKTFEDACNKLGQSTDITMFNGLIETLKTKFIAEYKLIIVIKALNEGWWPDFSNPNEYKYWNYFRIVNHAFSYYATTYTNANVSVPSALYLKNSELAQYCKEMFIDLYNEYYIN